MSLIWINLFAVVAGLILGFRLVERLVKRTRRVLLRKRRPPPRVYQSLFTLGGHYYLFRFEADHLKQLDATLARMADCPNLTMTRPAARIIFCQAHNMVTAARKRDECQAGKGEHGG